MIPTGWKRKPLLQVATIQTGIAKGSRKLKNPVTLPYLRVANVQDGYLDLSTIKTIEIDEAQINRYLLQVGDVLLTEGGDYDKLGRGTVWKGQLDRCVHQNHVFVARPKPDVVLSEYLSLLTGSPYGKLFFLKCSKQSTNLASINSSQLKEFPVLLPPIPEQTAIADLLSTWDQAIEKIERLITVKEERFKWLLQSLIFKQGKKSGWPEVKLEAVFSERVETHSNNLPLLSITRDEGVIFRDGVNRKDTSNEDKSKYRRICPGDLGYNTMRMWQGVSGLSSFEGIVSPAYTICTPSKDVNGGFIAHLFKTPYMIHQFYRYSQGLTSDTWNLKFRHFKEIKIPLPPLDQQKQIASILNTARQEIDLLKKQAEAYRKQKRGLMQKLLTGTWRVNVDAGSKEGAL